MFQQTLNIEPTSKCNLQCIRCTRTIYRGQYKVEDLDLEIIRRRLTPEVLQNVQEIDLSGNYGDPIFYGAFADLIGHFKKQEKRIYIETNGSGRDKYWWQNLVSRFTKGDEITFSIDGLEDTNHIYRVGADWQTIQDAVEVCAPHVKILWKMIVFKHNEHQVDEAKRRAKEMGFSSFTLVKSNRFGNAGDYDELRPSESFLATSYKNKAVGDKKFAPKCTLKKMFYISASGHLLPCCWVGCAPHLQTFAQLGQFDQCDLRKFSVEEILSSPLYQKLIQSWDIPGGKLSICESQCSSVEMQHQRSVSDKEKISLNA